MNRHDDYLRVLQAFEKEGVEYVLVGGFAVILHGMQRLTRDIDIFVNMSPGNIERLRKALHGVFQDTAIDEITLEELGNYAVIRYGTPNEFCIDIMARLGQAFSYDDLEFEIITVQGVGIRIATPEILLSMKKNTLRPEDKSDTMFLNDLLKKIKADQPEQEK